ncbi:MAG TPA: AAA family ATPase [Desulfomonilia bacterium]
MTIFIIVGMPASGKNCAKDYAKAKGYPYFATGDIVRMEVAKRAIEANAENMGSVSTEMRGADGLGVTRQALSTALNQNSPVVFLEGMRSWPEIKLIKESADACVIAFLAPRKLRLERIMSRGRSDDSAEAFDARDMREIEYGTAVPVALADAYILNTSSMDDAVNTLDEIVKKSLMRG